MRLQRSVECALRTLVGGMDHVAGPPRRQRHVQGIEHQLFGECRGHRPADNATTIRIEHDREIEKARSGASAVKLRSTRSSAWRPPFLTIVVTNLRRLTPASPARAINRAIRLRPTRRPLAARSA
jgi:hypothetical protein